MTIEEDVAHTFSFVGSCLLPKPGWICLSLPYRRQPVVVGTAAPAGLDSGGVGQSVPGNSWTVPGSPTDDRQSRPESAERQGADWPGLRWRPSGAGGRPCGYLLATPVVAVGPSCLHKSGVMGKKPGREFRSVKFWNKAANVEIVLTAYFTIDMEDTVR